MSDQTNQPGAGNVIGETVLKTAGAMIPAMLLANPAAGKAAEVVPLAIQLLQTASQLQQAGAMTEDQLAALFSQIGQGIQSTHSKWVAMNAASKATS